MINVTTFRRNSLLGLLLVMPALLIHTAFANDAVDTQPLLTSVDNVSASETTQATPVNAEATQPAAATVPMAQTPSPQPPAVVATVLPKDYWVIRSNASKLRDYSKRKFEAHTITLTNTQPYYIEILNAQVTNALNEQQLAAEKAKSKRRGFGLARLASSAIGTAAYIPGVGGLATMGAGGLAVAQAANAAGAITYQVSQMDNGHVGITGTYVQRFNDVVLGPNQQFTFEVVTPKKTSPDLRMVFKNLETNQILDIQETLVSSSQ